MISQWFGKRAYRRMLHSFAGAEGSLALGAAEAAAKGDTESRGSISKGPPPSVEPRDEYPPGRIAIEKVLAGLTTGLVFCAAGVALGLYALANVRSPSGPGGGAVVATLALWAFAGAYLPGSLMSGPEGWFGSGLRMIRRLTAVLGTGAAICALIAAFLWSAGLLQLENTGVGLVLGGGMGLVLGAFVFYLIRNSEFYRMFPLLHEVKEREDRKWTEQLKGD
jgi:hypothetical protein